MQWSLTICPESFQQDAHLAHQVWLVCLASLEAWTADAVSRMGVVVESLWWQWLKLHPVGVKMDLCRASSQVSAVITDVKVMVLSWASWLSEICWTCLGEQVKLIVREKADARENFLWGRQFLSSMSQILIMQINSCMEELINHR